MSENVPDGSGQQNNTTPVSSGGQSGQVTAATFEAIDKHATTAHRTAVAIYLGCIVLVFLVAIRTPLATLWRDLTDALFLSVFGDLGTTQSSNNFYMTVAYVVILAVPLYLIARRLFTEVGSRLAINHPVNKELRRLEEKPRTLAIQRLVSSHASGWVKLVAASGIIIPATGSWWRGLSVGLVMTAFLSPAMPEGDPTPRTAAVTSGGETTPASEPDTVSSGGSRGSLPGHELILAGDAVGGLNLLENAARRGDNEAYAVLGRMHKSGSGAPKSTAEARRQWSEGAERDDPASSYFLALDIAMDEPSDPEEQREAFRLALRAEATPNPERDQARILLGYMYILGFGTTEDSAAARRVLESAYSGRSLRAAQNLASLEARSGNATKAFEVHQVGALAGFGVLQHRLALHFQNADGVQKNDVLAFAWAFRSARQGNVDAQLLVGQMYHRGEGVSPDRTEAAKWFRLAAEQGNSLAMEWLGFTLQSVRPIEAYVWYSLAVSQGKTSAAERRDDVAKTLTQQQISSARSFSTSWRKKDSIRGLVHVSGGTGFFVSPYHDLVTNEHVIAGCLRLAVEADGKRWEDVTIVGANRTDDLALLRINLEEGEELNHPVARFAPEPSELGEELAVFGYPLSDLLSSSGVLNFGSLSANVGIEDDTTQMQISVPIQPGNSGGAVLDQSGRVVGVVVSTLLPVQQGAGVHIPQNVNFAIKGSVLREMLRQFGRDSYEAPAGSDHKEGTVLGRMARSVSARIFCYGPPQI